MALHRWTVPTVALAALAWSSVGCGQTTTTATEDATPPTPDVTVEDMTTEIDTVLPACTSNSECDDGDACNGAETCDAETGCVAGEALTCDDQDACNGVETCEAETGCVDGETLTCDDQDACNGVETCVAETGCVDGETLTCDDQDACNGVETCVAETGCVDGEALTCDDQDACNGVETCVAETGCVEGEALTCDDQDACNGVETCVAETGCVDGETLDCDDALDCTADSCDATQGCAHAPEDAQCDDAVLCNGAESCDVEAGCQQGEPPPNCCVLDTDCDDALICTGVETCDLETNTCLLASAPDCDDGEACTIDTCSEEAGPIGCVNSPAVATIDTVTFEGVEAGQFYNTDVSVQVTVEGSYLNVIEVLLDDAPYEEGSPISEAGPHTISAIVTGCGIEPVVEELSFVIDKEVPFIEFELSPEPNDAGWNNAPVTVTFIGSDALTDVVVSEPIVVDTPGAGQLVSGTVTDAAGNQVSVEVELNLDFKSPSVTIDEPTANQEGTDQLVTSASELTFEGVFGDDTLSGFSFGRIASSKQEIETEFEEPGDYSVNVPLAEGVNTVIVSAHDIAGNASTASLCVIRDTQPPQVFIQAPSVGQKIAADTVDVLGLAHDLVVGEITSDEVSVTVTTSPGGAVVQASVESGHFVAEGVALVPGLNTLKAEATDSVGLQATHTITVERLPDAIERLEIVSGNLQNCTTKSEVPEELVVRLLDADDAPVPSTPVVFAITGSNGTVSHEDALTVSPSGRRVIVSTDEQGLASASLTCGSRAGAGVDRVTVSAEDLLGSVSFFATASAGVPANIFLHAGEGQTGATGEPLPMPLAVLVSDHDGNAVEGMAVSFAVTRGDGKLGGQSSVVVTTNAKGYADVAFVLGQEEGYGAHAVTAQIPPIEGSGTVGGVTFTSSALAASEDPLTTSISGLVVDENEEPLAGVTIRFPDAGDPFPIVTGEDGRFTYFSAPAGYSKMVLDGSTVPYEGDTPLYPTMTFEVHNVAGQDNRPGRPFFMLQLDNPIWVDGLTDTKLTLEEAPGFELTIPAGTSLTFPDGSHEGWLSVTQVHFDQAPMAPSDGLASRMLVTIQPPGVHFDPPAPLQIPNVDGYLPGQKVEMYSYDHDLEAFVTIGPGSVSENGILIQSDPGVGVVKGGWHCGGNPDDGGGGENITAKISAPATAKTEVGGPPIDIGASGSPGPNTGWGVSICDGSGGMSCSGTSCDGTLAPSPSRKVKIAVVHCMSEPEAACAHDEKEVLICAESPSLDVNESFKIPADPSKPLPSLGGLSSVSGIASEILAASKKVKGLVAFMGSTCKSDGFNPSLEGQITITSGCCGSCPTKNGTTSEASLTLKSGNAGFSCSITHPAIKAITKITEVANALFQKVGAEQELKFEAALKAEVNINAQGNVTGKIDTCEGSSSLSGGASVTLSAKVGGSIDIEAAGVGLDVFVGGKANANVDIKISTDPGEIRKSGCWSGLELEASYALDFGPFVIAKDEKVLPISCPGELFNSVTPFNWPNPPPAECDAEACTNPPFEDNPDPNPPGGGSSNPPSACPGGPASSFFGDCKTGDEDNQCESASECFDNRECTEDNCIGGVCFNDPSNACFINGSCVDAGVTKDKGCKICSPSIDGTSFTPLPGKPCTPGFGFDCGVCSEEGECVICAQ